jgi:hypothetical protein
MTDLTPAEKRLHDVLRDGALHPHTSLLAILDSDGLAGINLLRFHVCLLRRKLNPFGLDVMARNGGYQLVRLGGDE